MKKLAVGFGIMILVIPLGGGFLANMETLQSILTPLGFWITLGYFSLNLFFTAVLVEKGHDFTGTAPWKVVRLVVVWLLFATLGVICGLGLTLGPRLLRGLIQGVHWSKSHIRGN